MNKDLLEETCKLIINEDVQKLEEMANYYWDEVNLPVNIWVDDMGKDRNTKHNDPRIKIQNDYNKKLTNNLLPISISKNPKIKAGKSELKDKDLNIIFEWIIKNYDILMSYWNKEIRRSELEKHILK